MGRIIHGIILILNSRLCTDPVYKLATDWDISMYQLKILPKQEGGILELIGDTGQIDRAIAYLEEEHVQVEILADKMKRDNAKCVNCGACTAVCRTDALLINRETMEVIFYPEKCVACGLCKMACPVKAMSGISIDKDSD